jgi:hypothetical protein
VAVSSEEFPGKLLLPNSFKIPGLLLALAGVIAGFLRFVEGIKPDFLDVKVFAIYSMYFDTKYFKVIGNNISEEIAGLLLLTGLFFFSFACEKTENAYVWSLRIRAIIWSIYLNSLFLFLSFLFVYGLGFVFILVVNIFSLLIFYNLFFHWYLLRKPKAS